MATPISVEITSAPAPLRRRPSQLPKRFEQFAREFRWAAG
jgi:hypothetical protein